MCTHTHSKFIQAMCKYVAKISCAYAYNDKLGHLNVICDSLKVGCESSKKNTPTAPTPPPLPGTTILLKLTHELTVNANFIPACGSSASFYRLTLRTRS